MKTRGVYSEGITKETRVETLFNSVEGNLFSSRMINITSNYSTNNPLIYEYSPHLTTSMCEGPVKHVYPVKKTPSWV